MIARHLRLITVLCFAVLILILAYLVMSVTSCAPVPQSVQATPMVRPMPTVLIADGTLYHPYRVDPCPCAVPGDLWQVWTVTGVQQWLLNWLYDVHGGPTYALHPHDYILYQNQEYQISGIDRVHLRLWVVPLGN